MCFNGQRMMFKLCSDCFEINVFLSTVCAGVERLSGHPVPDDVRLRGGLPHGVWHRRSRKPHYGTTPNPSLEREGRRGGEREREREKVREGSREIQRQRQRQRQRQGGRHTERGGGGES